MIYLPQSIKARNGSLFNAVLKQEICALDPSLLPLQQGLKYSNYAISETLSIIILTTTTNTDHLSVKAGLFYSGITAGCNCADDPTPIDQCNEYCEVIFLINIFTAATTVKLID